MELYFCPPPCFPGVDEDNRSNSAPRNGPVDSNDEDKHINELTLKTKTLIEET